MAKPSDKKVKEAAEAEVLPPVVSTPRSRAVLVMAVAIAVVVLDQILKIWVKTNFFLGEDYEILPFFHLRFIQNNGMAFGMELGSKLLLTGFRIVLVAVLIWYMAKLVKASRAASGYFVAVALVAAGAFGNIIDCVLYGEIFTNPCPPEVATLVPVGHGYGTWFQGLVVDMLYFPLVEFRWPDWMPLCGGSTFSFFDPVFNVADSAITVGMLMIVFFYSKYLGRKWYADTEKK